MFLYLEMPFGTVRSIFRYLVDIAQLTLQISIVIITVGRKLRLNYQLD